MEILKYLLLRILIYGAVLIKLIVTLLLTPMLILIVRITKNEENPVYKLRRNMVIQLELNDRSERILNETKDILKRIMNPASHASLIPLYEAELKKAIDGVIELKTIIEKDASS